MLVNYTEAEDNMGDMKWMPLKVVACMGEPIISYDDGLCLDGILAYGAYLAMSSENRAKLPPIVSEWAEDFELPLAKWAFPAPIDWNGDRRMLTQGGFIWGWCASAANAEWQHHSKMEFRRRPAVKEMAQYTSSPSHHLGVGAHKAYDLSYPSQFAREIWWYALGIKDDVNLLLTRVRNIGKKGALGMGKVLRWEVEEIDEDWSIARDGKLTRRIPRDGGMPCTIRAPYHHLSRRVSCAEIGTDYLGK